MPRWRSKIKRTLGTKSREQDTHEQDYRYPPKPDSYYDVKEKGHCRWCDSIINDERGRRNMRASWHPECSEKYLMIYDGKTIRDYMRKRDYAECAHCGEYDSRFEVDHIKPLYEQKYKLTDEVDWSYWGERNLQTLCRKCHKEKTKEDVKRLNKMKKSKKKPLLCREKGLD